MITYGWTEQHVRDACAYAARVIGPQGSQILAINNIEVKTRKCRLGNSTLDFRLTYVGSYSKINGSYPRGICYSVTASSLLLDKQPIPTAEVMNLRGRVYMPGGREYTDADVTRGIGLCWHTFGHFMAHLFESNPDGRLVTGANIYEGREDFEAIAGDNKKPHKCDCVAHGIDDFLTVTDDT